MEPGSVINIRKKERKSGDETHRLYESVCDDMAPREGHKKRRVHVKHTHTASKLSSFPLPALMSADPDVAYFTQKNMTARGWKGREDGKAEPSVNSKERYCTLD